MEQYFRSLAGRTFVLAMSIGLTLAIAEATGAMREPLVEVTAGGIGLAVLLSAAISRRFPHPFRDVLAALRRKALSRLFASDFRLVDSDGAPPSMQDLQCDLDRAYLQFVETMAQALDARDRYTAGHSLRVGAYAHAIAAEMGCSSEYAENIRIAAQLHDIGKIGIPDAVLQKSGLLTPEEFGLIKLHPQIGRKILEKVGRFERLLGVVELHHENHDGTGYPYGLAGEAIPLDARIVHVADSFDAMITSRSYRAGLSLRAAMYELERNSGRQFDPQVVKAFLRLIAERRVEIGSFTIAAERSEVVREPSQFITR